MFYNARRVYSLNFSNGLSWYFIATDKTDGWLDRFAAIMKLKPEKTWPEAHPSRCIFFLKNKNPYDYYPDLPANGWKEYGTRPLKIWSHIGLPGYICQISRIDNHMLDIITMWQLLSFIYAEEDERGSIPLHGAFVRHGEKGVLIAGRSGSGKSTLCRRLSGLWRAVSDDQSFIVDDIKGHYRVHPIPTWSDYLTDKSSKTYDTGYSLPVSAIFFIEQSDKDNVIPMGEEQAALSIYASSIEPHRFLSWDRNIDEERRIKVRNFDNACRIAKSIPAYALQATRYGRCWEKMEEVLSLEK